MTQGRKRAARMLKTARGQLDGILKMLEEDQYCVDISNQILASRAILSRANREILRGHMETCMKAAFRSTDQEEQEAKLDELMALMEKM